MNIKNLIIPSAVFFCITAAVITILSVDASRIPSTKGLYSRQTAELFYTGMHHLDLLLMRTSSAGKNADSVIKRTEQTAVTAQLARTVQRSPTLTPAQWFYLKNKVPAQTAGITLFKLDNIAANTSFQYDRTKRRIQSVSEEYGKKIVNGQKTVMYAEYFYVRGGEQQQPTVTKHFDTLTLTFKKNRWIITDIEQTSRPYRADTSKFVSDYTEALSDPMTGGSVLLAASDMRKTYKWLPSPEELVAAGFQMIGKTGR